MTVMDPCSEWPKATNRGGYGVRMTSAGTKLAHRLAWEAEHGEIPAGMVLHHLCANPACVNPAHLELMTPGEHTVSHLDERDGFDCGHPFEEANTYWLRTPRHTQPRPRCKRCRLEYNRAWRARNPTYHRDWQRARAKGGV